jgi:uncharacterized protein YicC (UPF0701 family)
MSMMAYAAAAGAVIGAVSSIMGGKAAAKEADRRRAAEIAGAKLNYASTESAANLMKAQNREYTANMMQEALRAGAAQNQDVREEVTRVGSTLMAQSEGLTSGRSKGRQMVELQVKGNQVLQQSKGQTVNVLNKLVEQQDKTTNDLNNKLLSSWQEMSTVLTTPGAIYQQNPLEVVQAGISGAQQGASLHSSMSKAGMFSSGAASKTAGAASTGSYTGIYGREFGNSGIGVKT